MAPCVKDQRQSASQELFRSLSELGGNFFDEAMQICDDEREAALLASASLVRALERERILKVPAGTRREKRL